MHLIQIYLKKNLNLGPKLLPTYNQTSPFLNVNIIRVVDKPVTMNTIKSSLNYLTKHISNVSNKLQSK